MSVRNVAWSIGERVFLTVLTLVSSPIVVSSFGEARYGMLSLGLTTVGFLAFADLGITTAAVRELAHAFGKGDKALARRVMATTLTAYLVLATVMGGGLMLGADWLARSVFHLPPDQLDEGLFVLRMAGVGLALNLLLAPWTAAARALQRFDLLTQVSMAMTVYATVGLVVCAKLGSVRAAVLVQLSSTVISMLVFANVTRRLAPELLTLPGFDKALFRDLFVFAFYQFLNQILGAMSMHADKLIIAAWLTTAEVTYYQIAVGLSQKIHVITAAAANFVLPRVAELTARGDRPGVLRLFEQGARLTMLLAMAVGVPLVIAGPMFLAAWMGPDFAARASSTLQLTAVAYMAFCTTVMPVLTLLGLGHSRQVTIYLSGIGLANVGLALVLVPRIGRDGAAWSMVVAMAWGIATMLGVQRQLGGSWLQLGRSFARLVPALAASAAVTWLAVQVLPGGMPSALLALAAGGATAILGYLAVPLWAGADAAILTDGVRNLRQRLGV